LSRMHSPVTSRLNWANERSTLSVSRSHARSGVELPGDRDERDAAGIEDLDHLGEVGERAGGPVDLVDHHHVDTACLDIGHELLECGSLHGAAEEAAVVVKIADQCPAFVLLAEDASLPLRMQGN
jgi:hypothetical protein